MIADEVATLTPSDEGEACAMVAEARGVQRPVLKFLFKKCFEEGGQSHVLRFGAPGQPA